MLVVLQRTAALAAATVEARARDKAVLVALPKAKNKGDRLGGRVGDNKLLEEKTKQKSSREDIDIQQ